MAKKIFVTKPTVNKKERFCLQCGSNISHRSSKVQFCCSHCKAVYKVLNKLDAEVAIPEEPKKVATEDIDDAASVYYKGETINGKTL